MRPRKYYGAGIILYSSNSNGCHVLLERRSDDHTWAIPGGEYSSIDGYSGSLPNLKRAAQRELWEETGIAVRMDDAWHLRTYRLPFFVYSVYAAETGIVFPLLNAESEDAGWFPLSKLPDGMNLMTRIEVNDFKRRMGNEKKQPWMVS